MLYAYRFQCLRQVQRNATLAAGQFSTQTFLYACLNTRNKQAIPIMR